MANEEKLIEPKLSVVRDYLPGQTAPTSARSTFPWEVTIPSLDVPQIAAIALSLFYILASLIQDYWHK